MTEEVDALTFSSSCAPVGIDLTSDVAASQTAESRGRIQWPGGPSIRQSFSLPESIIYYIAKNPSFANVYLKLIQSCKYFFEVNPIIVAARIHGNTKICSKGSKECKDNDGKCCIDLDITKLSSRIWLTEALILDKNTDPYYTSLLSSKLFRSDIDRLLLFDKTVLLDDFKILASFVADLNIGNVQIIKNDGRIVSIDEVLEFIPKFYKFSFFFTNDESCSTLKNFAKLNDLLHLRVFGLINVPENFFTVEYLSSFIKAYKGMLLLDFDDTVSEDYKDQLDALVDAIIESEVRNQIIIYTGLEMDKYKAMVNRMDQIFKPFFV